MVLYEDDEKSFDNIIDTLGTLSAQKIFFTLTAWERLSALELSAKTKLSESAIHQSLNRLKEVDLVEKVSRGVYSLKKSPKTEHLKNFCLEHLFEHVGQELYDISKSIGVDPIEDVEARLDEVLQQWKPIIDNKYSFRASALVGAITNKMVYKTDGINK